MAQLSQARKSECDTAQAKLKTSSWISGVPEPLPEGSRSPNQKPQKRDRKYTQIHRHGHVGPGLTWLALDKKNIALYA